MKNIFQKKTDKKGAIRWNMFVLFVSTSSCAASYLLKEKKILVLV